MNCADVETLWADWLGGELDADRTGQLEAHLSECRRCRQEAEGLRRTMQLLQSLEPGPQPAMPLAFRSRRGIGVLRSAAAVLLAFAVGFAARGLLAPPSVGVSQVRPGGGKLASPAELLREQLVESYAGGGGMHFGQLLVALAPEQSASDPGPRR